MRLARLLIKFLVRKKPTV